MPPRRIDKRRRRPCAFGGTTLLAATAPGAPAKVVSFGVSHAVARFARELTSKT
jgi:hypothetical protein